MAQDAFKNECSKKYNFKFANFNLNILQYLIATFKTQK